MKKILVPTDFSACADAALQFAVHLSAFMPVEIVLMHSHETLGAMYTDYMGANKEYNQAMLTEAEKKLEQIKKDIESKGAPPISVVMYAGETKENILDAIHDKAVDMVVMGTAGASGIKGKIWGSKTASLIGKIKVPLVVIPSGYEWSAPKNILLATSEFEDEPELLNPVFELAGLFMAKVKVMIFTDEDAGDVVPMIEHSRMIHTYSENLKEFYHDQTLQSVHLSGRKFADTLQEYIDTHDTDMLVMLPHQRSFFDRLFHPSITKKMAYHSNIPLLIIPEKNAVEKTNGKGGVL